LKTGSPLSSPSERVHPAVVRNAAKVLAFDAIGRRLEEARQQHEGAKVLDEALFGEEFETA